MANLNLIGLDSEKAQQEANALNLLLSNYQMFYQNLRAFHWNIRGNDFFELHTKFEELYTEAATRIDEIAERILTLGFVPLHSYQEYINNSKVEPSENISDATQAVKTVLENILIIFEDLRRVEKLAADAGDSGTEDMANDIIASYEKTSWMLNAWLG